MPQSVTIRRKKGKIQHGVRTCETRHNKWTPPWPIVQTVLLRTPRSPALVTCACRPGLQLVSGLSVIAVCHVTHVLHEYASFITWYAWCYFVNNVAQNASNLRVVFKDVWCGFSAAEMVVFATGLIGNIYQIPHSLLTQMFLKQCTIW